MSDPNANGQNQSGQQGQPEYGAYAPNQSGAQGNAGQKYGQNGQPGYGPYAANPNGNPDPNGQYGQQGRYSNPNGGQYYGQNPYGQVPYGQPYAYTGPDAQGQQGGQWPNMGRQFNPFKLIEEMLPQKAKSAIRAIYGVIGVAAIVLGAALLFWPGKTLMVFAVALGIYFVVSGVIRMVSAIVELGLPAGWRILDIFIGFLLTIGGVSVLKNTALSGTTLAMLVTLTVGIGWILEGVMALAESWRMPSSGWAVLYAIVSIIAGAVILFSPVNSTVWLVVFAGCALIVMGISSVVRAFTFGKPSKK